MNTLPLLYHTHHNRETNDHPFWLDWAEQQGSPILELGCGTGRVLLPLAQAGHAIVGVDHDSSMLAFLQKQAENQQVQGLDLILADMSNYHLTQQFALILMPCNTYSTLRPRDQKSAAHNARVHLKTNGIFIVSMPNPALLATLPAEGKPEIETTFAHPLSGYPVQVMGQWKRADEAIRFFWHYDHLLPDGRVNRRTLSARHYLQRYNDILASFTKAGLVVTATYGNYDQSVYKKESPYLIIAARKRE
ncbi:MAG: class I SAM-dependent methyltransferase [Chloroflexota bacterium]|nr:class I SAM-dependent methyltransferase [Chloroflexota bacterium]